MHWSTTIVLTAMMVTTSVTLVVTTYMGVSQYHQAVSLASIPIAFPLMLLIASIVQAIVERRRQPSVTDSHKIAKWQLETMWAPSLAKLKEVVEIGERRIDTALTELEKDMQGNGTSLYGLIRTGYKCIQTTRAVQVLCSSGYPDQALSMCRTLLEQEANMWFIETSDDPEEVAQRYLDWQNAKFYCDVEKRKPRLDETGRGPTKEEWQTLTEHFNRLEEQYRDNGSLRNREHWAIATRRGRKETVKAFSVQERARQSLPRLVDDEAQIHEAWTEEWQRLNEFVHTTPRSIFESASSNRENVVITGPSSVGIGEPLKIAGRSILNISTILGKIITDRLTTEENSEMETLKRRMMKAFREMLGELENLPEEATPWHSRS